MKQYMLAVHGVDGEPMPAPAEMQQAFERVDRFNQEMMDKGLWVFGGGLEPVGTAQVVNGTGAEVITTDGPFAESKEHLGGFWVLKADDLPAALELAARASAACAAPVEVRPFQDEPEA